MDRAIVVSLIVATALACSLCGMRRPGAPDPRPDRVVRRLLDLNRATADDLAALPAVGSVRAAAIVEERTLRGRFDTVDELEDVPGIGPRTVATIRPFVTVFPPP